MSSKFDAFILIGGRSNRFGSDKAFAALDGKTLASRSAETVEQAISPRSTRFVVGSESQFRAELIFSLGRPVVSDLKPGFGSWSGFHTALSYSASEWTFIMACDLPYVSGELINRFADLTDEAVDAVVPRQPDDRLQPLCAFYRRNVVLKEVERRLEEPGRLRGLTTLVSTINTRIVEEPEYGFLPGSKLFFLNINSIRDLPADFAPN